MKAVQARRTNGDWPKSSIKSTAGPFIDLHFDFVYTGLALNSANQLIHVIRLNGLQTCLRC